jgi:hypothetical protein
MNKDDSKMFMDEFISTYKVSQQHIETRDAKGEDVDNIIQLYNEIYNNNYPYIAWTDKSYVKEAINKPNIHWKVFEDRFGNLAGSHFLDIDHCSKTAMYHGCLVSKDYQGIGLGNKMILENYKKILEDPNNGIMLCWGEVRSAHPKSQKMFWAGSYIPIAFLPHKDIFLGKRESDIIMSWFDASILKDRRKDVKIIQELIPFYNFVSDFMPKNLDRKELQVEYWNEWEIQTTRNASITIKKMKYNYTEVTLEIDEKNYMKFKINHEVDTAEEFVYEVENVIAFNTLLKMANRIFNEKLEYIEIWVSAYDTAQQKSCISMGFTPSGYFPAVALNKDKKREDRIVFVKAKSYDNLKENLELIEPCAILFNLFKRQLSKNQQMEEF